MIKWFAYIVVLLVLMPCLSPAINNVYPHYFFSSKRDFALILSDSTKAQKQLKQQQQEADNKKKVKELTNAKHLPKPEKVDQAGTAPASTPPPKAKPKRQRRPQGLERPPELPRRYGS